MNEWQAGCSTGLTMTLLTRKCAAVCRGLMALVALLSCSCAVADGPSPTPGTSGASGSSATTVPSWAHDEDIDFYAAANFEISKDGVAPTWGQILRSGRLRTDKLLSGEILIVGSLGSEVRTTITEKDPRIVSGHTAGGTMSFFGMQEKGTLSFKFQGQHVQTPDHLRASRFDVYRLGVVPYDIVVTPDNIEALRAGATLLGSVSGSDMVALYF